MKIFSIACLCFMFIATGYAIMCYKCEKCDDDKQLVASQLTECHASTCKRVSEGWTGSRSCGDVNDTIGCNKIQHGPGIIETCICKGDKCNGPTTAATTSSAGSIKSSIVVGSVISLLVVKFIIV